jgi:hypothetical protein
MALTDILSGAINLGRSLISPSKAVDVVAITGAGFVPLFSAARPLTASVYEFADVMEHPLETGSVIADHIVFQPIEIELPLLCVGEAAYRSTYAAIRTVYSAGTLLTIRTRTGSYPNMVITDLPHDETPDAFNAIAIRLRLREARLVAPQSGLSQSQVANPANSSTANRGTQQTTAANATTAARAGTSYQQSGAGPTPSPQGSTLRQWYDAL